MVNAWLVIKNLVLGGNYFARGDFVLYINHSGKYNEINFNMKIPFLMVLVVISIKIIFDADFVGNFYQT